MKRYDHFAPLVARVLLATIFLVSGFAKIADWGGTAEHMASRGLPLIPVLLAGAILVEAGGGLMLLLGLRTREVAMVMLLYLVPVTLVFHPFWAVAPAERLPQMVNFLKNIAIMGGLLHVFAFGPGRLSVDERVGSPRRRAVPRGPLESAA